MKNLGKIFILISLTLFISSCVSSNNKKILTKIDNLLSLTDSINTVFESDSIKDLKDVYAQTKTNDDIFRKYITDTEEINKFSQELGLNGSIDKGLKRFFKKFKGIKIEVEKSKIQLTNLRDDISNNVLSDSLAKVYFITESQLLKQTLHKYNLAYIVVRNNKKMYDNIKTDVERIANSLKPKGNTKK